MRVTPKVIERELQAHWLTRKEAAHLSKFSGEYIHRLAASGKIGTLKTPLGSLYSRDDVERIAANREKGQQEG